jgi:GNAT superfamily N-acetyltransferase
LSVAGNKPLRIEKLRRDHNVDQFDCGNGALNMFLHRHAWQNQQANAAQTYVGLSDSDIVGYYSLSVGSVRHEDAPERMRKGLARHPIPILLLARLAVSAQRQGQGIGSGLLKDALGRGLAVADIAGIRAFTVHAKNNEAAAFYRRFNFIPSDIDESNLFVLLKDVKALIG